jgi:polyferredoxin
MARLGDAFRRHQGMIRGIQWAVVVFYAALVVVPAFLPLPDYSRHIWDDLTLFAQFLFWGIWWPFVLLSMVLLGRVWCGVFCPEGTLSEWASRHGRGGGIPRWMRWGGWPMVAFVLTTVYGQMISVYQYPKATLLILGGSTVAAVLVGYLYGRNRRVWCRYLCPVNGVFGLLAKLAPLHYRTDPIGWSANRDRWRGTRTPDCPTLLPLRALDSGSPCHMCGRCSGHREAIGLSARPPGVEVVMGDPQRATLGEFLLITFGLGGIAVGAFHWSASPWFVALKQQLALWLVEHNGLWLLQSHAPWWLFTNYPQQNDVFNLLDGGLLLLYIILTGVLLGAAQTLFLGLSASLVGGPWRPRLLHLGHALIPLVGAGVFLGLSALTVSMLRAEQLSVAWAGPLRAGLLGAASTWSLYLLWRIVRRYQHSPVRALAAFASGSGAVAVVAYAWYLLFWGWA